MRPLLLDTHALLWLLTDDPKFGSKAKTAFLDPSRPVRLSIASLWEMAIKISIGKLSVDFSLHDLVQHDLPAQSIDLLNIEPRHIERVVSLPFHHRDPFDRVLVAQAHADGLLIASGDVTLDAYGVTRIW
ncbi:MAG: type II toxin-antitoxin system VapC family toxin [Myxococcota bacterium]